MDSSIWDSLSMPTVPSARAFEKDFEKWQKEQAAYEEEQAKQFKAYAEGQKKSVSKAPENQEGNAIGAACAIADVTLFADWILF